ncbi:MAG: iron-containing redox enzyme family protein [Halobacteriovoraceae bacterium]|nr:iron-containing redox enzyme family protein [Halobacteriovoraceae bacterium]
MTTAKVFLSNLREEVETHPAVNHGLLRDFSNLPYTKDDFKIMGLQHFPLVGNFTYYLELLLLRAPDSETKRWLSKVLLDEYGERSEGIDHTAFYKKFLEACGVAPGEELAHELHNDVCNFIKEHIRICSTEPFMVGLGALGPGHEWAIPKMFNQIVRGLKKAGLNEKEYEYFSLHMAQDVDHGNWMQNALEQFCTNNEAQVECWKGAMLSLEARNKFWSAVQSKMNSGEMRKRSSFGAKNEGVVTFKDFFETVQNSRLNLITL